MVGISNRPSRANMVDVAMTGRYSSNSAGSLTVKKVESQYKFTLSENIHPPKYHNLF